MCLGFDTSNYFAAAGARARSCCMHLVPGWLQEMPGVIYMLSLKPRIWWLLQDSRLAFAVTIQMCFGGHGDSRVLNASVLWAHTWGDKFWSYAPALICPAERRVSVTWAQQIFKAVYVHWGWSYYSFYQNFEDLVLFTHLINRWLSALERGLLN